MRMRDFFYDFFEGASLILSVVAAIVLSILIMIGFNAVLVFLVCSLLKAIGIYTIFGWTVKFSWALVLLCTVISMLFNSSLKIKIGK